MGILNKLFSKGGKAGKHYRDGLAKAQTGDWEGAIAAYELTLRFDPSDEMRASAQFNRGLAYAKIGEFEQARDDYNSVTQNPYAPSRVKDAARDNLQRLMKRKKLRDEETQQKSS